MEKAFNVMPAVRPRGGARIALPLPLPLPSRLPLPLGLPLPLSKPLLPPMAKLAPQAIQRRVVPLRPAVWQTDLDWLRHKVETMRAELAASAEPEQRRMNSVKEKGQEPQASRLSAPSILAKNTEQSTPASPRISPMKAWDELDLNELGTRDEIARAKGLLVLNEGTVAFAKPDAAPDSHRRFVAAFPTVARRLFNEQQSKLMSEQTKQAFIHRDTGLA